MTTIAYCHKTGTVAVDSRVTSGTYICSDSHDKTIKNDLGLWLFAGSLADQEEMAKLDHNDKICNVSNRPDVSAYLIRNGKCYGVYVDDEGYCKHTELKYSDAIGSGGGIALAALDLGKTARGAIEFAATRDSMTGGKIACFYLKDSKPKNK